MPKKYLVHLSDAERDTLHQFITRQQGSAQKVRRAQILLKADANGPNWTDQQIADAFDCRTHTVANLRQRLVEDGFELALHGKPHARRPKKLTGDQEAEVIALRLGPPPAGFAHWSLRLLARRVVELEIVEDISHEAVRQTLKQTT